MTFRQTDISVSQSQSSLRSIFNFNSNLKFAFLFTVFLSRSSISLLVAFVIFAQFRFHNNGYDELLDSLGEECLPDEYGGTNGPIDYEKSLKFVLAREKMLAQNRRYGVKATETPWQTKRSNPSMTTMTKTLRNESESERGRAGARKRGKMARNKFKCSHVQNNILNWITQCAQYHTLYLNLYLLYIL